MSRRIALWRWTLSVGLWATAACATGRGAFPPESAVRPARDLPDRFVLTSGPAPADSAQPTLQPIATGAAACQNPLIDPRDGGRLRLIRSQGGRGDYEVPAGRYGLAGDELLRIDCATLRAMGRVPRRPGA